jgi:hypothetical protein
MLGAWVIYLVIRWRKYPKEQHGERNCQFIVVLAAIIITVRDVLMIAVRLLFNLYLWETVRSCSPLPIT